MTPCVRRVVRHTGQAFVEQAVDDAILDYLARPQRFDHRRGTLLNYLTLAAVRKVLNLKRADLRRHLAEGRAAASRQLLLAQTAACERDLVDEALLACCDGIERAFARAWLEGATIAELVPLMGSDVSVVATKDDVRRRIECLRLRLKRYIQRSAATRGC
jgi:hypothetical protein